MPSYFDPWIHGDYPAMVRSRPGLASEIWTWAAECAGLVRRFGLEPEHGLEPEPEPEPMPDLDLDPDSMTPFGPTISTTDAGIDITKPAVASPGAGHDTRRAGRAPHSVAKIRTGDATGPLRRGTGKRRPGPESPIPAPQPLETPFKASFIWLRRITTLHPHTHGPSPFPTRPRQLLGLTTLPLPLDSTRFLLPTLTSITLNHLRRTLQPALAAPVYHTPLEDLRIARSNPAYFLDEALSVSWGALVFSWVQKGVWDLFGGWLLSFLSSWGGGRPGRGRAAVIEVVYLVWMLASVEYVFMRSCSAVAFAVAGWKLRFESEVGRRALVGVFGRRWDKGVVMGLEVGGWVWWGLVPLGRESVRSAVVDGRPGMLLVMAGVVGVVVAVLEWRSVFFIALEVSGVFVAGGYFAVAVGVWLGREREGEELKTARPDSVVKLRTPTTTRPRGMTRRTGGARHG